MKNKLLKHTGAMLLLLACCLTSCIKEEGFTPTDKASVTLTFTTRAPGDDADPNAILEGEGMKNLRVIVVDQASKEIRFNRTFPVPDNATSHTVRFGDLYAGRTYDFYAIANASATSMPAARMTSMPLPMKQALTVISALTRKARSWTMKTPSSIIR